MQGRGDNYRTRYIVPMERHIHHHGGYGRPFPPKYKDILADRGSTAGELGFYGKRQENLDTVFVPLPGAEYSVHGINYHPVQLMKNVKLKESLAVLRDAAKQFEDTLTGFASLGYDTPGYGYGEKDKDGTPKLSKGIAEIANNYNVPYLIDNAWGIPFIGTNIRNVGADLMIFSMDKASGSPTGGLIIGKEDIMVPIRRALGYHGARYGTTASYGKAAYVTMDPGKESLSGMVAALKVLRDTPEKMKKPIDELFEIVTKEFSLIDGRIKPYLNFFKSYNSGTVEINYEDSWKNGKLGIPIFSIEDMYSGSNLLQDGCSAMGIIPTIAYDANIFISPGLGTTDRNGNLIHERVQMVTKGLVKLIEIVCEHAGIFE
jgi:glutaredoxin-related protein